MEGMVAYSSGHVWQNDLIMSSPSRASLAAKAQTLHVEPDVCTRRCSLSSAVCLQLKQQSKEDTKQGALMHVTVESAQARLIVLPSDKAITQSALDFIAHVDPPSQGVPMRQVRPCPSSMLAPAPCCHVQNLCSAVIPL